MSAYTDPGNPLLQERLNGLQAFYNSSGLDADQSYQAAVNGINGMVQLQSFFLSMSEILFIGYILSLVLASILFILWVIRNYRMLFNFINFKKSTNENLHVQKSKI
jgi:uncharacterized membrane protein YdbT with pleckstrin-like domain